MTIYYRNEIGMEICGVEYKIIAISNILYSHINYKILLHYSLLNKTQNI